MKKAVTQNCIRETLEDREFNTLSEFATKSKSSKGRARKIEECQFRTCFQRDRDRILHCKSFRRLKHKTQVFLSPYDDHFRTRLTHTLEVAQIARTISRALMLNEDLTEAIALGHDLGHTPFGHCGEGVLNKLLPDGFKHNIQSVRVVEVIEDLNLCRETVDGILTHSWGYKPKTPEAQVVQLADKIAYINHDIQDSVSAGVFTERDLPKDCIKYFTSVSSKRLDKMVSDIIFNSQNTPKISMSEECWTYTSKLRDWMFENVYVDCPAKQEEKKASLLIEALFNYYKNLLKAELDEKTLNTVITDYISGMTDRFAIDRYSEIFIPKGLQNNAGDKYLYKMVKALK